MPHIAPKPMADYPWIIRWFMRRQRRIHGEVLAPSWLWGRLPGAFLGLLGLLAVFQRRSYPVDAGLRSLVSIRIAQLNGCQFCVDLNAYHNLQHHGDPSKAERVSDWRSQPAFTPAERAALDWAERMTADCAGIDETALAELRCHYSEDQITALTAWIGFQNMSAKFNAALGAEPHGFCTLSAPAVSLPPARQEDGSAGRDR